ncbi:MAG TPA: DUF2203 domain-containing protein [Gemmataceae bacterium]|nr:DUF2203 domain-containing protein [Gemmataceae bacterium]
MASSETSKSPKLFTAAEANAMLPLVRAIVKDIVSRAKDLRDRQERIDRIRTSKATASGDVYAAEIGQAEQELERDQDQLLECQAELAALGVELKDFFSGLIDFPSRMDDRIVYLCWRFDEPSVAFWHELDAGFAGRQKLVPDCAHV